MLGIKLMAASSGLSALIGAAAILDQNTLLPVGLVVAGVTGAVTVAWRAATALSNFRHSLEDHERRLVRLEAE